MVGKDTYIIGVENKVGGLVCQHNNKPYEHSRFVDAREEARRISKTFDKRAFVLKVQDIVEKPEPTVQKPEIETPSPFTELKRGDIVKIIGPSQLGHNSRLGEKAEVLSRFDDYYNVTPSKKSLPPCTYHRTSLQYVSETVPNPVASEYVTEIKLGTVCRIGGNTDYGNLKLGELVTVANRMHDSYGSVIYSCYHHRTGNMIAVHSTRLEPLPLPIMVAGKQYRVITMQDYPLLKSLEPKVWNGAIVKAAFPITGSYNGVAINSEVNPCWLFNRVEAPYDSVVLHTFRVEELKEEQIDVKHVIGSVLQRKIEESHSKAFNPLDHELSK